MGSVAVTVDIQAPLDFVWARLSDLSSHSEWMSDAASISFLTEQRRGEGVRMQVPTRVGVLRITDLMEIDEWIEGRRIGVRHVGPIGGWGRFELSEHPPGCWLTWTEHLRFPWYLGGFLAERSSRPILRRIFRANLIRFKERVEGDWEGERGC
ncbi:MAG: SRPBCC family protein [bacterium]|nr:SRPBCC family protein [bacterium]MDE0500301.1 SRPBCC family protein [bacterium]